MGVTASQITSLTIVYSTVYSDAAQRKHQSSTSLAFVRGTHQGPMKSPHKWPVARKMFPLDDVIVIYALPYIAPQHYAFLSMILCLFWGASLKVNGVPWNIQGNLTGIFMAIYLKGCTPVEGSREVFGRIISVVGKSICGQRLPIPQKSRVIPWVAVQWPVGGRNWGKYIVCYIYAYRCEIRINGLTSSRWQPMAWINVHENHLLINPSFVCGWVGGGSSNGDMGCGWGCGWGLQWNKFELGIWNTKY